MPTIGGMSGQYLLDSMEAYRENARPCPETKFRAGDRSRPATTMCRIAADLTPADTVAVAGHLSGKPFVRAKQQADPDRAAVGRKLHALHCGKCHSDGGGNADDDAGILAGQWMPYLRDTMKQYTSGARPQPKPMKAKLDKLTPEEIEALIHFYGSGG